jgi:hypothetical protein
MFAHSGLARSRLLQAPAAQAGPCPQSYEGNCRSIAGGERKAQDSGEEFARCGGVPESTGSEGVQ